MKNEKHMLLQALVVIFACMVAVLSIWSNYSAANSELNMYFTAGRHWNEARMLAVMALLIFTAFPVIRYKTVRLLMATAGIFCIALGVYNLFYASFVYIRPLDFFVIVEGSVLYLLCSMQLGRRPQRITSTEPAYLEQIALFR